MSRAGGGHAHSFGAQYILTENKPAMRLKSLFCLLLAMALQGMAAEKPNVLMIVLDDMNDWLGVMGGHPQTQTPNMDRLAGEGVLFRNAHANVAVCSPSRASFMSGVHPLTSGCWGFDVPLRNEVLKSTKTLPEYARENGYKAYQTGKIFHHIPPRVWTQKGIPKDHGPMAWNGKKTTRHPSCPATMDDLGALDSTFASLADVPSVPASGDTPGHTGWWDVKRRKPFRYINDDDRDLMVDERSVVWLREKMATLTRNNNAEPFLMAFGVMRPHTPLVVPQKYFDMFPLDQVELPAINTSDMADLPWGADSRGRKTLLGLKGGYDKPLEGLRTYVQAYLACVAFADDIIGQVLDILDTSRFKDNTIVVLFSDHGYHVGEKDCIWKYTLWEESTRVPLIVRDPRHARNAGKTVDHPVSLIDIFPTITDLCGMTGETVRNGKGAAVDGHSLRPFLDDPDTNEWDGPDAALSVIASWKSRRPMDQHLSIRTKGYRYSRYHGGGEELYDHRNDPNEWTNLADNPEYAALKKKLAAQLDLMVPKTTPRAKPDGPAKPATAKSDAEQWKDKYFGWHPDADTNGDGVLTWPEYKVHKAALDARKKP